jgi:hypothetical protein
VAARAATVTIITAVIAVDQAKHSVQVLHNCSPSVRAEGRSAHWHVRRLEWRRGTAVGQTVWEPKWPNRKWRLNEGGV